MTFKTMFWLLLTMVWLGSSDPQTVQGQVLNPNQSRCSTCPQDIGHVAAQGGVRHRAVSHRGVTYYAVEPQLESPSDIMDTTGHGLNYYRKKMRQGNQIAPCELVGKWRGVNRGIVEVAGFGQFIKDFKSDSNGNLVGDNIQVHQVKSDQVRYSGWKPVEKPDGSGVDRKGKFAVQHPAGVGRLGQGLILSYRNGGNPKHDPAAILVDRVVKLDDDHLLGRASANFGIVRIPLSFFVLEKIDQ